MVYLIDPNAAVKSVCTFLCKLYRPPTPLYGLPPD